MHQKNLYELCQEWEDASRSDLLARHRYNELLSEIEFHANLRYADYEPFADIEGTFHDRLYRWIVQLDDDRHRRALLEFVPWLIFIDKREMRSLYRDAYRRCILPWIPDQFPSIDDQLTSDHEIALRTRLNSLRFYSITESFAFKQFENTNSLNALPKPTVLGDDPERAATLVKKSSHIRGHIILEDVVGTGKQAARVLKAVMKSLGGGTRVLFVPLVMLEPPPAQVNPLMTMDGLTVRAVSLIPSHVCVTNVFQPAEPSNFAEIRSIVNATAKQVCTRLNDLDNPPKDPFGYGGTGATIVPYQNVPNNTLSLVHHKAPAWSALFRRSHHSKGEL